MTRLFVEQLTVIDCARLDAARGLVGESWIVDLELEGDLDDQSMLLDFGEVKKRLKRAIDQGPDHTLLVPTRDPALSLLREGEQLQLRYQAAPGLIEHRSPALAVTLMDAREITPDTLAAHLQPLLMSVVPTNIRAVHLHLRSESFTGPGYHYVHGLKKHAGQCQRIAHGHRSRLQIRVNGTRDAALESLWAERWRDIYLGTREDIAEHGDERIRFEYRSQEGAFALELPAHRCDLLDADSTVERIAEHLARRCAAERPGAEIEVRAYEGVMKGAIARARTG